MARRNTLNGTALPMDAGARDRVVTIEQADDAVSTSKIPMERWTTLASTVWMHKRDANLWERVKSEQIAAAFDTQWEMGYWKEMDPELIDVAKKRRLVYQGRVHLIVGASQIGRREGIELLTISSTKVVS